MQELQASPLWRSPRPLVVLATGTSLDDGTLSRRLLLHWARDPRCLVLMTQRPRPDSLAAALAAHTGPGPLHLQALLVSKREPLAGAELEAWEAAKRRENEEAEAAATAAEADAAAAATAAAGGGQLALRASSSGISQLVRGAGGEVVQLLPGMGTGPSAAAADGSGTGGIETLMEGFVPPAGAVAPMFPDEDESLTATWDVYGAMVDAEAIRAVSSWGGGSFEFSADDGCRAFVCMGWLHHGHSDKHCDKHASLTLTPTPTSTKPTTPTPQQHQLAGEGSAMDEQEEEEVAAAEEEARPTRVVTETLSLTVAARPALIDFEGRSDGRSLRTIVAQVAPRQLVVVGAGAAATAEMADWWREDLARYRSRVLTPGCGEALSLSLASTMPLALDPHLTSGTHAHKVGQYWLAWLDGRLAPPVGQVADAPSAAGQEEPEQQQPGGGADADMSDAAAQPAAPQQEGGAGGDGQQPAAAAAAAAGEAGEGDDDAAQAAARAPLQLVPGGVDAAELQAALDRGGPGAAAALLAAAASGSGNGGIFIGDVKLSEVKQALARAGIPSAFRAGKLLCAGAVVVSRGSGGDDGVLEIEGPLSEDYYRM